jgi:hypothetical protein
MTDDKPKAKIEHVNRYEVIINDSYGGRLSRYAKTQEEAEEIAKKWEAEQVAEWERINSEDTKRKKRNDYFWAKMQYFMRDLKTAGQQAGKRKQFERVEALRWVRTKMEQEMSEANR